MWDLPGPGIKPMSPALVGRFFHTESPEKPSFFFQFQVGFITIRDKGVLTNTNGHLIGRKHYPVHIIIFCVSSAHSIYTENHCCMAQEYLKRLDQSQAV